MHGYPRIEEAPVLRPGPDGGFAVVEAICKVMGELPNIGKDDQAPAGEGRYRYRGIEAITRHVQQLLAKHGVVIIPRAEVLATVPSPAMDEGWQDVIMRVEWSLFGLDGSSLTAVTNGVGRDKSDKGANKAQTQAYKYLLLHVLCVADGKDDADGHSYEDGRNDTPQPVERLTAPTGEVVDIWPGELSMKAAKGELLAVLGGDKDAATKAWTASGFDGRWKLRREELDPLLALMRGGSKIGAGAEPDTTGMPQDAGDAQPATSPAFQAGGKAAEAPAPNEGIDARAIGIRSQKVFDAVIERYPDRKKAWTQDHLRHALAYTVSGGKAARTNLLDPAQIAVVWNLLDDIEARRVTFTFSADPAHGCEFTWADGTTTSVMWSELTLAEVGAA